MQNTLNITQNKPSRNYGIDLLRIFSMLMVVVLHVLGQGGILYNTTILSYRYEIAWLLETACFCAVNCYGIISGYVGFKSRFKYSNIVYLWCEVAFYTVLIAAISAITSPTITKSAVFDAFFPVTKYTYWYFTAYFCIYFFTPIINKAVDALNEKQLKAIFVAVFVVFCILPLFAKNDLFRLANGYSALWLFVLYLVGAIINKCNLFKKLKSWTAFLLYFLMIAISMFERFICDYVNTNSLTKETLKVLLTKYISPTIFMAAIFLFIGFSKLKINNFIVKIIKIFAPVSFGVYLIHVNPYVWELLKDKFKFAIKFNSIKLFFAVLCFALIIFIVCALLDYIRELIFKLFKVKKIIQKCEAKLIKNIW